MCFTNNSKASKLFFGFILVLVLFLGGCYQNITISTYADYDLLPVGFSYGDTFAISKFDGKSNLLDKEIMKKIKFALQNRGYTVTDAKNAQYLFTFDYEMESEVRTEYIEKIVGTTTVAAAANAKKSSDDKNSSSEASGTLTTTEKRMVPVDVRYYNKTMDVAVSWVDRSLSDSDSKIVWTAQANIFNTDKDLRSSLNYLLAGIFEHFGKNTKRTVNFNVNFNNKVLKEIRDFKAPKKIKYKK